jgi:NADPH:quinone reductase-like Zn-dependent oxidoreductase
MRKVVIHRRGGYDALRLEDHPSKPLAPSDVRIGVEAAGVNYADCVVRMGLYASARELVGWPITPGFEVAGTVTEVGEAVDDRKPGDQVIAVSFFDGYADEVVVPSGQVFERPQGYTATEAAGFPAVGITADYAMWELVRPPPGAWLLVHSAAGGVGNALVRLGRALQCHVVGVVGGPHKVDYAREAGATVVIDTSREDLWSAAERASPTGYHAIFDANGISTLRQSFAHVAPTGRLVVYGFATMLPRAHQRLSWLRLAWHWLRTPRFDPLTMTNTNRSVMAFNLSYLFVRLDLLHASMERLLGHARQGVLPPPKVTTYPLREVGAAHRDLESGQTIGKLVLVP